MVVRQLCMWFRRPLKMSFFQRVMILALVPLTIWSGSPHLACRCSTGEVRLFCSRLTLQTSQRNSNPCLAPDASEHRSCCGGAACCGSTSNHEKSECCASGCRCTPVLVQADAGPTLKKVVVPELIQLDLATMPVMEIRLPRVTRMDLSILDVDQRVPDDLIVLCERWLI